LAKTVAVYRSLGRLQEMMKTMSRLGRLPSLGKQFAVDDFFNVTQKQ